MAASDSYSLGDDFALTNPSFEFGHATVPVTTNKEEDYYPNINENKSDMQIEEFEDSITVDQIKLMQEIREETRAFTVQKHRQRDALRGQNDEYCLAISSKAINNNIKQLLTTVKKIERISDTWLLLDSEATNHFFSKQTPAEIHCTRHQRNKNPRTIINQKNPPKGKGTQYSRLNLD